MPAFFVASGRSWPTDDGPNPLTACPKPDAQGAALKVSFAVLRLHVARPGIGQKLPATAGGSGRSMFEFTGRRRQSGGMKG